MRFLPPPRRWRAAVLAVVLAAPTATPCPAVEMFTYFGDGSRIGLPSLEVPVEAYPGIPLRSDRLRARRRAMRMGGTASSRAGGPTYGRGITIRAMPASDQPVSTRKPRTAADSRNAATAKNVLPPVPETDDVTASSPAP